MPACPSHAIPKCNSLVTTILCLRHSIPDMNVCVTHCHLVARMLCIASESLAIFFGEKYSCAWKLGNLM